MWMMWIVTDDGSRLPLSFFSLSIEFHSLSKIWVRYRFTKFVRSLSRCFCYYPLNWFVYLTLAHVWVCTIFHCCLICVLWISDLNLFSLENECTINKCRTLFFVCSSARTHKGHVFFALLLLLASCLLVVDTFFHPFLPCHCCWYSLTTLLGFAHRLCPVTVLCSEFEQKFLSNRNRKIFDITLAWFV